MYTPPHLLNVYMYILLGQTELHHSCVAKQGSCQLNASNFFVGGHLF